MPCPLIFSLNGEFGSKILQKSDGIIDVALCYHVTSYRDEWKTVIEKYQEIL